MGDKIAHVLRMGITIILLIIVNLSCCCIYYRGEEAPLETSSEINTGEKIERTIKTDGGIYPIREEIETPDTGEDKIYIRYPRILNYTILEYGIHSEREEPAHYVYLDTSRNRTVLFIYGGKKLSNCHLSVEKVVEYSEGNVTLYLKETCKEDPVVTSPYVVVEIEGIVEHVKVVYID